MFHNFPKLLDEDIVKNGGMAQRLSDKSFMYTANGTITYSKIENGVLKTFTKQGVYTIGVNSEGIIYHRCFYEMDNFIKKF